MEVHDKMVSLRISTKLQKRTYIKPSQTLPKNSDLPSGMAKMLYSQCRGPEFNPWSGN